MRLRKYNSKAEEIRNHFSKDLHIARIPYNLKPGLQDHCTEPFLLLQNQTPGIVQVLEILGDIYPLRAGHAVLAASTVNSCFCPVISFALKINFFPLCQEAREAFSCDL